MSAQVLMFPLTRCATCGRKMYGDVRWPAWCSYHCGARGQPEHTIAVTWDKEG